MKKLICIMLAMALVFAFCACGGEEKKGGEIVSHKGEDTPDTKQEDTSAGDNKDEKVFSFEFEGVAITPGEAFDKDALPEPNSKYTVPSCAVDGNDDVYEYGDFEITVFTENGKSCVYSVYFIEPSVSTAEGLSLGDEVSMADSLYPMEYKAENGGRIYTLGSTSLHLVVENGVVTGIEYLYDIQ